MNPLINIIGAGKLGQTLGHLWVKHQLVAIGSICNTSQTSSIKAIQFIGQGHYGSTIHKLPPADVTLITTPEEVIAPVGKELSNNPNISGSIVLHCSGSLTSDALKPLKEKGCFVGSIHPMRSFVNLELSVKEYSGTYCAMEGDKEALVLGHFLFSSIGSITYEINKLKKPGYHAAGVFASNYLVTLAQQALSCMQEAEVEQEVAMNAITHLMQSTVTNLKNTLSPEKSLTGPIKRGDVATIRRHIEALTLAERRQLYSMLGKATLELTDHHLMTKNKMTKALSFEE